MPRGDKIVAEGKQAGAGEVEVYEGDATDRQHLGAALADAPAVWYLIHSMGEGDDFRKEEREMAQRFAAVTACGVIGSVLSKPDSAHYRSLKLPSWKPPAIAFPIVWTALYSDIAVINSLVLADHIEGDTAKSKATARKHAADLVRRAWKSAPERGALLAPYAA